MKKVLLFSALFLLSTLMVFAYETIIIKFPDRENWVKAYYKKVGLEAILQYVPAGQGSNNWTKSVVVHSYNQSTFPISVFLTNSTAKLLKTNPTANYKTLRLTDNDAIVGRCTKITEKHRPNVNFLELQEGMKEL